VVALWALLGVVSLSVVALARQVGLLHLRVRPLGPGPVEEGPALGSIVSLPPLTTFRQKVAPILVPGRIGVVLFASPTCGLCKNVLTGASRLQRVDGDLQVTVAVDAEGNEAMKYLEKYGFDDGVAASELGMLDSGNRPYAVAVNDDGMVLSAGAVNTLDQLEGLADLARRRADGADEEWRIEARAPNGKTSSVLASAALSAPNSAQLYELEA
jgi:methylamine dehydrogenase accessory protein MauD